MYCSLVTVEANDSSKDFRGFMSNVIRTKLLSKTDFSLGVENAGDGVYEI